MKLLVAVVVLAAVAAGTEGAPGFWDTITKPFSFTKEAVQGAGDMVSAYGDMREANWKNSDKYFHARGNHDAAQRGPGGAWAAEVISNARDAVDQWRGGDPGVCSADQEADKWERVFEDPRSFCKELVTLTGLL
ncbi:amyloid protein A-like isoform X1 [Macrobrachium rosenbergii]|uniref:amyloid protein A-like isoform X1 n=1 Tax=Macrobrachium rosenbergii TaxID=79674 RepID=UPI0034D41E55